MRSEADKIELLRYVGDMSQIAGIKDYTLRGGKAEGMRAVDINNGSGMVFTVIPDRCMDISWFSYKGINFSYISKTGMVSPQYYNERGDGFSRSFGAGFLTTCGLSNVGTACEDEGKEFGVHGRISNTPAEEVCAYTEWINGKYVMKVKGKMREARLFGENLILEREISSIYGCNKICINDTVRNNGFRDEPIMILYHFNLGYPLLTGYSYLVVNAGRVTPRDQRAAEGIHDYMIFQEPTEGFTEQVYYHDLKEGPEGKVSAALVNPKLNLGILIRFKKAELPRMTQWKQMGEAEYVLGIEPCNCHVEGRQRERQLGTLEYIKKGKSKNISLEIEVIDGRDHIEQIKAEAGI